ncbi:FtsB family cell division protein [Candidatus Sneabacter namystus]|uniref:Septum formation initiator family protein n=1 Tax=Candidatus Sneabacter namystus TaxID=2601646 RepID=A0A5C0UIF5_9RICK|nr:septum formation initiator family protein [Candidatus Sneabacter namystus]QEK39569.1 septum formation initiator family protein [Candidatus Sneabacter namystus]
MKNTTKTKLAVIITIAMSFFLIFFHLMYCKRGLVSYVQLHKEIDKNSEYLEMLKMKRISLENKIELLQTSSLDLDFLEEQARKILDMSKNDEVIVIPSKTINGKVSKNLKNVQ